jgi:hypothetical protein
LHHLLYITGVLNNHFPHKLSSVVISAIKWLTLILLVLPALNIRLLTGDSQISYKPSTSSLINVSGRTATHSIFHPVYQFH